MNEEPGNPLERTIVERLLDTAPAHRSNRADGVEIHVQSRPTPPVSVLFPPMVYLVFQGEKRILTGDEEIRYGPGHLVIMSTDLPALVEVTEASVERPYVALGVPLDRSVVASLIADTPARPPGRARPVEVRDWPEPVLAPALRLVEALADPIDAAVLSGGIRREIFYRVLQSPAGDSLRDLLESASVLDRLELSMSWAKRNLHEAIRVDDLAARSNMSPSSFHRAFKSAVGTSPLNYLKALRMHEARRRIALQTETIEAIAHSVGYVSPSQFSRDYKRQFGAPPSRDKTVTG